jgi:hypothetical protein
MPRSIISFSFEDGFIDSFDEGLEAGTAFRGLSKTAGCMETFFLVGVRTRGIETVAGVTLAMETFRIVGVVGIAGTEAKVTLAVGIVRTIGIAEIEAEAGTGVALGMEAFPSCARLNKNSM